MPIPTDTFWNIKRLNFVFAISAVALVLVTMWSVLQDYQQMWRKPQQNGRVWEAALVREKLTETSTADRQQQLADLDKQIEQKQKQLDAQAPEIDRLKKELKQLASQQ